MNYRVRTKRFGWPVLIAAFVGALLYFGGLNFLAKAAVPAAVGLAFGLARRYLPARALADETSPYDIASLNERFRGTQWIVGFAMVVVGIVFFWLTHLALVEINRAMAASKGAAHFVLLPQTAIWWFFPGFGALSLSWEFTLLFWSTFGDQKSSIFVTVADGRRLRVAISRKKSIQPFWSFFSKRPDCRCSTTKPTQTLGGDAERRTWR